MSRPRYAPAVTAVCAVILGGCSTDRVASSDDPTGPVSPAASESVTARPSMESATTDPGQEDAAPPVSVLGLAEAQHRGDRLRIGTVRSRNAAFTSYNVRYRSSSTTRAGKESYTITGVLNVPRGPGPFPAVVLAHGYIDPTIYVRGQGMTRERDFLASRGYIALHVDYRNHAGSDVDPLANLRMRLGYSADVINAVKALRGSRDVRVADDQVFLFGRSMGGGVVLKALVAEPGLVRAAVAYSSVSSMERHNYNRFIRSDPEDSALRDRLSRRYGTPAENPTFWRQNSSRPYFDRITEPVLLVHGRSDSTCPPRWAAATKRALDQFGADAGLAWYDDEHAFVPAFSASMDRIVRYFDRQSG